jgi:hypothetical protein
LTLEQQSPVAHFAGGADVSVLSWEERSWELQPRRVKSRPIPHHIHPRIGKLLKHQPKHLLQNKGAQCFLRGKKAKWGENRIAQASNGS